MTGPAERARLAELARAATGGPWYRHSFEGPRVWHVRTDDDGGFEVARLESQDRVIAKANAAYIAAANPTVILALLARLAALEAVASAARNCEGTGHARSAAALRALDGTEGP